MPADWLGLTTHRLDIYNESLAKSEFLEKFQELVDKGDATTKSLEQLPTAYDYIRLGHPLSSILEWSIGGIYGCQANNVISFASNTMPLMAVFRKAMLEREKIVVCHDAPLPANFDEEIIKNIYGYDFEIYAMKDRNDFPSTKSKIVYYSSSPITAAVDLANKVDFIVLLQEEKGSVLIVENNNSDYVKEIQHVRRRETVAMTPINCLNLLKELIGKEKISADNDLDENKKSVENEINSITETSVKPLMASSGLSMQYAIMMGLIDKALENHPEKPIKIVVPPNCYGGTNDQARRVAACNEQVSILDLHVDGDNDMVLSVEHVLHQVASEDAIALIIAEIPTNPRVEVPDLVKLNEVLTKERKTPSGENALAPIFILDQTFCPNIPFLKENYLFSSVQMIAYVSGSKFPSGGKCTAGYCVSNLKGAEFMTKIEKHLELCNNEATPLQLKFLAEQLPSMLQRIESAYINTRAFVNFINEVLPEAKINFVSEKLAKEGFTPSVFSLDLPTKGETAAEKEVFKRKMNELLIKKMITEIPEESKYCVSYGQLKGCYWTVPATSTQGTTKESDKDYIARVSVSPDFDLERHKAVFSSFVKELKSFM